MKRTHEGRLDEWDHLIAPTSQETEAFMEDNNNKYIEPQKHIFVPFYWRSNFSKAGMNKKFWVARHDGESDAAAQNSSAANRRTSINKAVALQEGWGYTAGEPCSGALRGQLSYYVVLLLKPVHLSVLICTVKTLEWIWPFHTTSHELEAIHVEWCKISCNLWWSRQMSFN